MTLLPAPHTGTVTRCGDPSGIWVDPWPARLLFVLVLMILPGSQILIYPILWILMPSEDALVTAHIAHPPSNMPPANMPPSNMPPSAPAA